ncbi:MAG: N-acetyl sugar amidotransferase [Rickettsiales bacterium]|nr:N-acetyl sugar amidotransferase [Rickettsiales bacterium]
MKHDVQKKYNLPTEVKFCKKCTISNQRPRITFDAEGVCSACNFAVFKRTLDWEKREDELADLCNRFRKKSGYDVLVPCSGGKDGGFTALYLKQRHNMRPLTCTWGANLYTDIGWENLENFISIGGFDNVVSRPSGHVNRKMTRLAFEHMGDPFQSFIYGQANYPLHVALQYDVPLIMYGENGEVEYGGDMKNAYKPTRDVTDYDKHYFSGIPPEEWAKHGINERDLEPYMGPPIEKVRASGLEMHFMGYYKFWDPQENFYYCVENYNFKPNPERNEGTYSKYASLDDKIDGMHYYLAYIKFGIGRTTSDTAHEIRDNKITREEGVALVKKFDGEFPQRYYQTFLDYCGISDIECQRIIDSWRADHIWERRGHNQEWHLKNPIWEEGSKDKAA